MNHTAFDFVFEVFEDTLIDTTGSRLGIVAFTWTVLLARFASSLIERVTATD